MRSVVLLGSIVCWPTGCSSGPTGMGCSVTSDISGRDSGVVSREKLLANS